MSSPQEEPARTQASSSSDDGAIITIIFSTSDRFPKWIALSVLHLVVWLAMLGSLERHSMDRPERWALTATTICWVISTLGVLGYLCARSVFLGIGEVGLLGIIIIIWAGSLPTIMNPANSIAVGFSDYLNANLYFGAWLSFFCALWIAGELARELYGMDLVGTLQSSNMVKGRQGKWYALIATSMIVMSSSVRFFKAFRCASDIMQKAPVCKQTKFAISAGAIGTVFAMMMTIFTARGNHSRSVQWISSAILVVLWSFGLGFVTFGNGPGQNIGNLYFATWASFVLSVWLAAESIRDFMGVRQQQQQQQAAIEGTTADEEGDVMEMSTSANAPPTSSSSPTYPETEL